MLKWMKDESAQLGEDTLKRDDTAIVGRGISVEGMKDDSAIVWR